MKKSYFAAAIAVTALIGGCTLSFGGAKSSEASPVNLHVPEWVDVESIASNYPIDSSLEEVTSIGPETDGTPIGIDYTCVIANKTWFLVNNLSMPTFETIDPEMLFVPEGAKAEWPKGSGGPESPIRIDSALLPYKERNNTGTESQWERVRGKCSAEDVNVSANAPQAFIDFLLSPEGQEVIAKAGIAYPITGMTPEEVTALAPRPE